MSDSGAGEVIYLTGAPASGKSTLCNKLASLIPGIKIYEYGNLLADRISKDCGASISQESLKEKSSALVFEYHVRELDQWLIKDVDSVRNYRHVIIDSHAVTLEHYGFRIIPFSAEFIQQLRLSRICCLYAYSQTITERIIDKSEGRPLSGIESLNMHTSLQMNLAATYSVVSGAPLYCFENSFENQDLILEKIGGWLGG
ncbi:AAA family ATPase [Puniceicoccales bacterium CK1056]|uniref:AAA family ATPase n=1 Tax=Oceanipulchritudo coccoides TaxID=2706888 RepID=A0A6B2M5F5_9BACT|nr:ATP-binding protein [Oceanipulchritudo coccoides]NDV63357.1 AAA family ATPase [Oceanipulchritudo coccoides]